MKQALALALGIALALVACAPPSPIHNAPHPFDVPWDDRASFAEGLSVAERPVLDRLPGATVYHIDLRIADDLARLEGSEQLRYTNREEDPLAEVYLSLFPNVNGGEMTVSAVRVGGELVDPTYEFADSSLRVPLPAELRPGEQAIIEIDFAVQVPREMGGNYGLFGYFEDVLVLDEFYPAVAVYDDEGWNVGIPSRNGDLTYYDASFYLVRVTAPTKLRVIASGTEIGREYGEKNQVLTFAAGPARDFYVAASERYTAVSKTVGETTIHSYAFEKRKEEAELALQFAADAVEALNARFGAYPYTELDVLSTPMLALGIEYPGTVGISLRLYDSDAQVSGLPSQILLESVVAHEVAHQWFYNAVGNDQVDEPWLDEAVVQYATGLYYLDVRGPQAAKGYRDSWASRWERVDRAEIPVGLPASAYTPEQYSPIVYGRGPLFIAALADEMGQETFDAFLRDYYASHKWDIGTGEGFRQLAEHHCQCDLTALFRKWLYPE